MKSLKYNTFIRVLYYDLHLHTQHWFRLKLGYISISIHNFINYPTIKTFTLLHHKSYMNFTIHRFIQNLHELYDII